MITEEKLAEWKRGEASWHIPSRQDIGEAFDTLSVLWRVAKSAEEFVNELQPQNAEAYEGVKPLKESLAALREGKETR